MEHHQGHGPKPRLDQQAALDELERFGRDIQRYRAQREALGDEFESFVQSFKRPVEPTVHADRPLVARPREMPEEPVPAPRPPAPAPEPASVARPPDPPAEPTPATVTVEAPIFETPATEISPPAMTAPPEPIAVAVRRESPKTPVAAIAAGAAILLGGGVLAAILWNRSPEAPGDRTATPDTSAAPAAAPEPAPASAPAAGAPDRVDAPASAVAPTGGSEIVIDRRVWMRVTVDGERVLEREVPAGTRIPLKAEKSIVIRTGDAGAVRLSIRGATPAPLGREGEVVTRSFTVPPR